MPQFCKAFNLWRLKKKKKKKFFFKTFFDLFSCTYHHIIFFCNIYWKFKSASFPISFNGAHSKGECTELINIIIVHWTVARKQLGHLLHLSSEQLIADGNTRGGRICIILLFLDALRQRDHGARGVHTEYSLSRECLHVHLVINISLRLQFIAAGQCLKGICLLCVEQLVIFVFNNN